MLVRGVIEQNNYVFLFIYIAFSLTATMNNIYQYTIEKTLKHVPPYIHDGYAVEYSNNDIDQIMSNIRENGFCIVDNVIRNSKYPNT